jgi:hypothetical protein
MYIHAGAGAFDRVHVVNPILSDVSCDLVQEDGNMEVSGLNVQACGDVLYFYHVLCTWSWAVLA